ncbi:MAG: helix-turn-helix domain-containing protein [Halothece sp.]
MSELNSSRVDYTPALKKLMEQVKISNFKQLSQQAGVSEKQILNLRRGKIKQMRLEVLLSLSSVLSVSLTELVELFCSETISHPREDALREKFEQESLEMIESWLLQWPTAVSAIAQNPDLPAKRVIKLLNPLEKLIQSWGVSRIGQVGEEVPYDPKQHQLLSGNVTAGETVRVRYVGYKKGDKLLYRAKVEPID